MKGLKRLIFLLVARIQGGSFLSAQLEKPSGFFGRWYMSAALESGNAALYEFSLGLMNLAPTDRVLEIGFGGGGHMGAMVARLSAGHLAGVDFAPDMVAVARRKNRAALATGRLELREGDVAALPYPDAAFDKVLTVNTLYFWSEPERGAAEILRVLKPGGTLYLAFRVKEVMDQIPFLDERFRPYTEQDARRLFLDAGAQNFRLEWREEPEGLPSSCAVITK